MTFNLKHKTKIMKILSKREQQKIFGGTSTTVSQCSMTCFNGDKISIDSCSDMCTCSESGQRCQCLADDVIKWCPE
jgi:hypothetical protein